MIVCRHIPPAPAATIAPSRAAESRQLPPVLAAVGRTEDARVLDAGKDRVRIVQRRFKVPDPCELPRVRCAVVPLVGAGHAFVLELVAHRLQVVPPSSERWINCPNHPVDCDAKIGCGQQENP